MLRIWCAELSDEEAERADETTIDEMIEDLEVVWGRMKDAMLQEGGRPIRR